PGELGILRQKAISGMDGIDLVLLGQRDDAVDVEVGAQRLPRRPDAISLVRLEAVQRKPILMRIDGHRAYAQLMGRAKHADGNFTAIGGKNLVDGPHGRTGDSVRHDATRRTKISSSLSYGLSVPRPCFRCDSRRRAYELDRRQIPPSGVGRIR